MQAPDGIVRVRSKLDAWAHTIWDLLPNIVVALVVFTAFIVAAKLARKLVRRTLGRWSKNAEVNQLLATTVRFALVCAGLFVALGILELDKTVTSLLAGVGVVGLALGFAFKDIAANYMSGVIIAVRTPFELGELVELKGYFGTVHALDLRATILKIPSGELVTIPNQEIVLNPIVNFSRTGERRVELELGVSYGEDLDEVKQVALEAVGGLEERDESREAELYFSGFGDSSIDLIVRFWLRGVSQREFLAGRSAAVVAIKRAFDERQITIPFPIRTLTLDTTSRSILEAISSRRNHNGRARREPRAKE